MKYLLRFRCAVPGQPDDRSAWLWVNRPGASARRGAPDYSMTMLPQRDLVATFETQEAAADQAKAWAEDSKARGLLDVREWIVVSTAQAPLR